MAVVQLIFFQPALGRGGVFQIEAGAKVGAIRALTHHIRFGAAAKAQPQRINRNRFTGAGFTGNRGHATLKIDFQLANNSKITDGELGQHTRLPVHKHRYGFSYSIIWFYIQ